MRIRPWQRVIGYLWLWISTVGAVCVSVAVAASADGSELVVSTDTAVSVGVVIVIVGVVGAWWQLRNSVMEQRLIMRMHLESTGTHCTIQQLEQHFVPTSIYEVKHQAILDGLRRIEQHIKEQASPPQL